MIDSMDDKYRLAIAKYLINKVEGLRGFSPSDLQYVEFSYRDDYSGCPTCGYGNIDFGIEYSFQSDTRFESDIYDMSNKSVTEFIRDISGLL